MAGIGFALRKLAQQENLLGVVQGYLHSALVSTGPWLFTILALAGVNLFALDLAGREELITFRLIIIYNFCFSLVFAGPLLLVCTRYLADLIYVKAVEEAPAMMLGALLLLFALQAPLVVGFYGVYANMTVMLKLAAIANFFVISGIWVVGIFLTALKDYRSITYAFLLGMGAAFAGGISFAYPYGSLGVLGGFTAGLAVILFSLIARVFAEYPYRLTRPFKFLSYFRRYWDLALSGATYNLAIWVDKWVMWLAPEREVHPTGLVTYPAYDGAMFLAYLSIVPAMSIFIVNIETGFYEQYQRFYRGIERHAVLSRIRADHAALIRNLLENSRNILVLQGCVAVATILLAPNIYALLDARIEQIGIFRFGVLGALFHVLVLFAMIIIGYFDLRRVLLMVQGYFLASNLAFSLLSLNLGFPYYGYGYFLACVTTLVLAYLLAAHSISRLPYLTFVRNNTSVD